VMVALHRLGRPSVGLVAATATGASICLVARWRGWRLPQAETTTSHKEQR
jgi:hypothetical protein